MQTRTGITNSKYAYALLNSLCISGMLVLSLFMLAQPVQATPVLTGIEISPSSPLLAIGQSLQLTTIGNFDDGSQQILKQPKQINAGSYHTCAVASDGTIQCWGLNVSGQLGDGTTIDSALPKQVLGITNAVAVANGSSHTCALLNSGEIQCWGSNQYGQLGNGSSASGYSLTPVTVSGISTATAVSAGESHSCALLKGGTVMCWGYNIAGQLGNDQLYSTSTTPVSVIGLSTATALALGNRHSCALISSGEVQCWGANDYGQLGTGSIGAVCPIALGIQAPYCRDINVSPTATTKVVGVSTATALASAGANSCAILASGAVHCWGLNVPTPVMVIGISTAIAVGVGGSNGGQICANLASGQIQCWGSNESGQLGNGTTISSITPVTVSNISTATAVTVGANFSCAALASKEVQCWGYNYNGQVGIGTHGYSTTPVSVIGIDTAKAVWAGTGKNCALLVSGELQCWGGKGASLTPVTVAIVSNAKSLALGRANHNCMLLNSGEVQCWGNNSYGQLGNGTTASSPTPVTVIGINTATAVEVGFNHSCALLSSGEVQCWGDNSSGQFGNVIGYIQNPSISSTPVVVSGINTAKVLAVGKYNSCVILASGMIQCWGPNTSGQLGNGTTTSYANYGTTPVIVNGISTAKVLSVGGAHNCAVLISGELKCWGDNASGQLGNGTATSSSTPLTVNGIAATTVAVGYGVVRGDHTCAVLISGELKCWGDNYAGQLGNGTTTPSTTPVIVNGISTPISLSLGEGETCALFTNGAIQCWGQNLYGQLGNGYTHYYTTPEQLSEYGRMDWNSSELNIATVTPEGLLTGVNIGKAFITVGKGGYSASTSVAVKLFTDLSLNITSTPASVQQGQNITYTVSVTNNGPSMATGVAATGTLPSCAIGTLAPSATGSCTATVTATAAGTLTQTMTASGNELDPILANNSKSVSNSVVSSIDLSLNLTSTPASVLVGQTITYTVSITNNGPSTATGVAATGTLPGCVIGTLAPSVTGSCTATVTATAAGTLTQTMTANGNELDPVLANNTQSISNSVISGADMAISMTDAPDPVKKGAKLTYTITVKNNGPLTASNVIVKDILSSNVTYGSVSTTLGKCSGKTTVSCALGNLANGGTATIKIVVKPLVVGTLTNSASVAAIESDYNPGNNVTTVSTSVTK